MDDVRLGSIRLRDQRGRGGVASLVLIPLHRAEWPGASGRAFRIWADVDVRAGDRCCRPHRRRPLSGVGCDRRSAAHQAVHASMDDDSGGGCHDPARGSVAHRSERSLDLAGGHVPVRQHRSECCRGVLQCTPTTSRDLRIRPGHGLDEGVLVRLPRWWLARSLCISAWWWPLAMPIGRRPSH